MKENNYESLEDLLTSESFRRWIEGEPGEQLFWEVWLQEHPEKTDLVEQAGLILLGPNFMFLERTTENNTIESGWENLRKETFGKTVTLLSSAKSAEPASLKSWYRRWVVAASIALVAALGFWMQRYVLNPTIVHQTIYGQHKTIALPDSSTVKLNANSRLTYRQKNPRKVWLDGEAFFHVVKKPATGANFQVLTNDLTVEVLGTTFNVIEKEYRTEVVLEDGVVKLNLRRDFDPELYLESGEMASFSAKTSEKVEKRPVESRPLTSWKDGVLQFDDVPLGQVMDRIEEIYGWRPVYHSEELEAKNVNFPLPSNDLENALSLLRKTLDLKIDKVSEDKVLLLYY